MPKAKEEERYVLKAKEEERYVPKAKEEERYVPKAKEEERYVPKAKEEKRYMLKVLWCSGKTEEKPIFCCFCCSYFGNFSAVTKD